MSEYFVDTSSLAGVKAASNRPRQPVTAPPTPPSRDGSRRGDAASSGKTTPVNPQQPLGANPGRQSQNTVGVLFPKPYSDVYVDTSSLQGILNAMNPGSPTWVGGYFAGSPGKPGTLPKYGSAQVQNYDWLFGIIAKDYYSTSTAKKWYEEQFLQQALNVSRSEGRMVNVVDMAYEYAVNKGLLDDKGQLTTRGEEAYRVYLGEKPGSSGGSGSRSYSSGGGYSGGGYSGGGGGQVSLTNPTSARGLLMQTMQGVLGRNPTEREYKDFIDTLKQTEMANPNTVSVEGDVVVQSGGTDPGVLALEFAQASEDYRSTQANKFYNAFMGALGGAVSG